LTGTIEDNWHVYSQDLPPDSGIPTEFKITSKQGIQLIGKVQEIGKKHDEFSEAFGAQIVYYSNKVVFKQKFKPKDAAKPATITAEIMYQTCNDRVCLAPNTLEFEKQIEGSKTTVASDENVGKTKDTVYEVAPSGKVGTVLKPTNVATPTVAKQDRFEGQFFGFQKPFDQLWNCSAKTANDNWLVLG
jgi:thiol:disulfide interchange protein DsbD